jgi:lipopolysaccharide export LptBFGC system permease protein LptF
MSTTLFWYIFRDLLRIFIMAALTLAGIMSFGGLLRPMTQNGLDASQIGRMLAYFMPAMMTYSLPVAALFATTIVYGRLASDNELTACRAGGISYLSIASPAFMLGLIVAILSLAFLCFTVPIYTLKVEKVIYSNLARLVANKIEREHEINIPARDPVTVYAQKAEVIPTPPGEPSRVSLTAPMIILYEGDRQPGQPMVPREFWTAAQADAFLREGGPGQPNSLTVVINKGVRIPREVKGGFQGGVEDTQFGPIYLPSSFRENEKFMKIDELRQLYQDPSSSRRVKTQVAAFNHADQRTLFQLGIANLLQTPAGSAALLTESQAHDRYTLGPGVARMEWRDNMLVLHAADAKNPQLKFLQANDRGAGIGAQAKEIRISAEPDNPNSRFAVTVELVDATIHTSGSSTPRALFSRSFYVPMSRALQEIDLRSADHYLDGPNRDAPTFERLKREKILVLNRVQGEMHSRASFAVSCLILVMVGCALGMMLRSGDFLSAFAASFVPALLSISLIIAGQQICENVPDNIADFHNPLKTGLTLIWSGNIINLVLAGALLGRLQRQ